MSGDRDDPWLRLPPEPPDVPVDGAEAPSEGFREAETAGGAAGRPVDDPWLRLDPEGVDDQWFNREQGALEARVARSRSDREQWLRPERADLTANQPAAVPVGSAGAGAAYPSVADDPTGSGDPRAVDPRAVQAEEYVGRHARRDVEIDGDVTDAGPTQRPAPGRGSFSPASVPVDAPDPQEASGPRSELAPDLPEPLDYWNLGQPPTAQDPAAGGGDKTGDESGGKGGGKSGGESDGESDGEGGGEQTAASVLGAVGKELAIVVGMAMILSFIVKSVLLQAFYIPSSSMEDTLQINDRVIVSKLTPGPFDLKRGDIIVFSDPDGWMTDQPVVVERGAIMEAIHEGLSFVGLLPEDSENHLIKRVVGLPGDHVACEGDGEPITVNGVAVEEPYLKPGSAPSERPFDIVVPEGKVWVMGDNRGNSADSRFHPVGGDGTEGSVDQDLVVGRAVALVWPLNHLSLLGNPSEAFATVPEPFGVTQTGEPAPTTR
jgi:signal peptidase I